MYRNVVVEDTQHNKDDQDRYTSGKPLGFWLYFANPRTHFAFDDL